MTSLERIKLNAKRARDYADENDGSHEADEAFFNAEALDWAIKVLEGKKVEDLFKEEHEIEGEGIDISGIAIKGTDIVDHILRNIKK